MSNVSMRTSMQQEMSELENYVKNQTASFRTKDLAVNDVTAEQHLELTDAPKPIQSHVKVDISEEGRLKAGNMENSYLAYVNSNAKQAQTSHYQEYEDALNEASRGFKEAMATQTIGKYVDSGVDGSKVDYNYIERLNSLYDELRDKIKTVNDGEEQQYRMSSLEKSYQKVFEDNILKPVKSQYDSQISFYRHGASHTDDKHLKQSYQGLESGNSKLADIISGTNTWHDSAAMKSRLKEVVDILVESAKSR